LFTSKHPVTDKNIQVKVFCDDFGNYDQISIIHLLLHLMVRGKNSSKRRHYTNK